MQWAYGITTVPSRRGNLLPKTLASLKAAGFDYPRLFVDGEDGGGRGMSWEGEFLLPVTQRKPPIRAHGNWTLGLLELLVRHPHADRYLMFQDDLVAVRNLRQYLEAHPFPPGTYGNLYTVVDNHEVSKSVTHTDRGWFRSNQLGKGALALVFDRDTAVKLVSSEYMARRPEDATKGHKNLDGGIVTALAKVGITEACHVPSLVQHTGLVSAIGHGVRVPSPCFPGEEVDIMEMMK